jgi:metal-responsive CopG/Arc/MetJ family transcriptional regulator
MKTAISIPDSIFRAAEKLAHRLGISRSELYANAVAEYIQEHRNDKVTKKLDEIYEKDSSSLDSTLMALQSDSIFKDEW